MSHPLPYCQCPRGNAPCGHDITQEDLLCDDCRADRCLRAGASAEMIRAVYEQRLAADTSTMRLAEIRIEWDGPRWPPPCQD